MDMNHICIRSFQKRLLLRLFLQYFVSAAVFYLFAWGTVTFILRGMFATPLSVIARGSAGLLLLFPAAFLAGYKKMPETAAVRALLDRYNRLGGIFMAAAEADTSPWPRSDIRIPPVHWRGKRELLLLGLAAVFLFSAAFTPPFMRLPPGDNAMQMDEITKQLTEKAEILEEEELLTEEKAEEIRQALEHLAAEARSSDPGKTWEALDHLEENLQKEAVRAAEEMMEDIRSLRQMQAVTEMLSQHGDLQPELLSEILRETGRELSALQLSEMMQDSAENAPGGSGQEILSQEMQEALSAGTLSKGQMEKLAEILRKMQEKRENKLKALEKSGMAALRPADISPGAAAPDTKALADFLKENPGNIRPADLFLPGRGGRERGRADAFMSWKERSAETGTAFKEEILPRSEFRQMRDNLLMGISRGEPETDRGKTELSPGGISDAPAGSGSAFTHRPLPRHKESIRRYFTAPEGEDTPLLFDEVWSGWG